MEEGSVKESNPKENNLVNKIEEFIVQKHRIILIAILAFAFILRLKYMTVNAALWWDEADYLTLAKHYGLGLPEMAAPWRARALSMLLGIFYWLGANELIMRFVWVLLSVSGVLFTYIIGKRLYGKAVGLLSALFLSVYFEYLFWSARFSLDVFVLVVYTAIMFLFWKGYVKQEGNKYLYIAAGLFGFGIFAYESIAFIFIIILLFLILTERLNFLKKKQLWYALLIALLVILPFAAYNQARLGHPYPRFEQQVALFTEEAPQNELSRPVKEIVLDIFTYAKSFPYLLKWPLFIAFAIGLSMFVNLFLGFDLLFKGKNPGLKRDLFIFLWGGIVLLLFSLIQAFSAWIYEPRFIFPMMPVVFIITACGIVRIFNFIKKYNQLIAVIAVIALVSIGIFAQMTFADKLIKSKSDSFRPQKEAGMWLKQNLQKDEPVIGCFMFLPFVYYTERKAIGFTWQNETQVEEILQAHRPQFIVWDWHDPGCASDYPLQRKDKFLPMQAFFIDKEKTQPAVVIFQVIYK